MNGIDLYGLFELIFPRFVIPRFAIPRWAPVYPIDPIFAPYYEQNIDMKDTGTWPEPPTDGQCIEGDPSRKKPRERGEKSLYDPEGGEWRPQLKDKYHPENHWNYKPPGKNTPWENVPMKPVGPMA